MDFLATVRQIESWATSKSIPTLMGDPIEDGSLALFQIGGATSSGEEIVAAIEGLNPSVVVLHAPVLTQTVYDAAIERLDELQADDETLREARECRRRIG